MSKRVLLTGGAGFIGHHVAEHILKTTDWRIVFLDRLDCAGDLGRIFDTKGWAEHKSRCKWVHHDLRAPVHNTVAQAIGEADYILHLAAMTHVDRAIADPIGAVMDNVVGTTNILEHARHAGCERFLYFSTDEVFGPAPEGVRYKEWDRYRSTNPYSAAKAGGEEMAIAYENTYGVPAMITHTMNVIGERQSGEKYVPSTIRKVRDGEKVTVHADPTLTKAGSRFYIHARNVADAILFLLRHGERGDKYNIVGEQECDNLELAQRIAAIVGKPLNYEMVNFHESRPGHDLRYALDGSKMESIGWAPPKSFAQSLETTVKWSLDNPRWLSSTSVAERTSAKAFAA